MTQAMKESINQELAAVFREVAAVLLYQGEGWYKVRSYIQWAERLDTLERPIDQLSDSELKAIPGVGKAIFTKTRAYLSAHTFNLLDRVRQVDAQIRAMLVAGVPPAAVKHLEETANITTLPALMTAHHAGTLDLRALPTRQRNALLAFLDQHEE